MKKKNWQIGFILPNLKVDKEFETEFVSIVSFDDERVQEIIKGNLYIAAILNGFIDSFRHNVKPSILIFDENAPSQYLNIECFVNFRNIVALSVIMINWSNLNPYNIFGPLFSDSFDFYPIYIKKDGSSIIETPALTSINSKKSPFIATSFPGVPKFNLNLIYDKEIYKGLLKLWELKYSEKKRKVKLINKIFRSIEVSYHALSIPKKNQNSINDIGINISLWISAFEILAHPSSKNVHIKDVLNLINSFPCYSKKLNKKKYVIRYKNDKPGCKVTLMEKLYRKLYESRNIFLHGNNIPAGILKTFNNKLNYQHNNISNVAPILYRFALCSLMIQNKIIKQKTHKVFLDYITDLNWIINRNYNNFLESIMIPKKNEI